LFFKKHEEIDFSSMAGTGNKLNKVSQVPQSNDNKLITCASELAVGQRFSSG